MTTCLPGHTYLTPRDQTVGAAIGIYTILSVAATNANHDAKRVALALDLLLILISGAPLNHAGRNSTG
ncbi:hypothetical protein, partial [Pseudomonas sp. L13]|uniref:hypothetical protein n=1 Tax=Pseudomonas sp. L13 TaxID=343985 RepID=UPI001C4984BB